MESGGNLKLEPGYLTDKWALSCIELMKNRLSQNFLSKYSIKNLNVMKVWKITNKPKKIIFDNNYDFLIDLNNKFGEEKKYYDFFFMFLEDMNIESITKKIFDNFNFNSKEEKTNYFNSGKNEKEDIRDLLQNNDLFMLSTHLDKLEEYKLNYLYQNNSENNISESNSGLSIDDKKKSKKLYTVICKCISFENLITKSSDNFDEENHSFSDLLKACSNFAERKTSNHDTIDKCILEITSSNKEKSIFITKNKTIFIPEYLLEYNYSFNNINIDLNSLSKSENKFTKNNKQTNIYNTSYLNKEIHSYLLKEDFIQIFNNSLRNLISCEINKYVPNEILDNYSSCKFQFLDEMNTTELFFTKNTILNFLHTSYKYSNSESFNEDFNKILEKLDEIKNLNFKNPLITINFTKNTFTPQKSEDNKNRNHSIIINEADINFKNDYENLRNLSDQNNDSSNISINTNNKSRNNKRDLQAFEGNYSSE